MSHTVALTFENQKMAMVNQSINHGGCHLFIGKYGGAVLLAFAPVLVLELSKRFGFIKHHR